LVLNLDAGPRVAPQNQALEAFRRVGGVVVNPPPCGRFPAVWSDQSRSDRPQELRRPYLNTARFSSCSIRPIGKSYSWHCDRASLCRPEGCAGVARPVTDGTGIDIDKIGLIASLRLDLD
jgi:hypothetical protein